MNGAHHGMLTSRRPDRSSHCGIDLEWVGMRKVLRILAIAFLAASVPLQGIASVMAGQCMALGHHEAPQEMLHAHDADGHDHTAHSHSDPHADGEDGSKGSHCGPCAACCASASISGPAAVAIAFSTSDLPSVFSPLPPPGIQPGALDRPPLAP